MRTQADAVKSVAQELSATAQRDQKVLARVVDISKRDDIDRLVSEALDKFKRLDILVNNAGIYEPDRSDPRN